MDRKMTPFLIKYDLFRPFGSQKIGYPVKISKMKHPKHTYTLSQAIAKYSHGVLPKHERHQLPNLSKKL